MTESQMTESQSPPTIQKSELGHIFTRRELQMQCGAIYGGVALPGKRPGFAVVVAIDQSGWRKPRKVYLLDEFESFDMRVLIRQCGVLDSNYHRPTEWIGDWKNIAASRFIDDMNSEKEPRQRPERIPDQPKPYDPMDWIENNTYDPPEGTRGRRRSRMFSLTWTHILDIEKDPYQYIVPKIKELRDRGRRQLELKDSKILIYLSDIQEGEIAALEFGEYPAIEALAFAVTAIQQHEDYDADDSGQPEPYNWQDWDA